MKRTIFMLFALAFCFVFSGCQSRQDRSAATLKITSEQRNKLVEQAYSDVYAGAGPMGYEVSSLPIRSEAYIRTPGRTKAYAVNRYVDPVDSSIMHERHVIYRQESEGDWRLQSNANQQILVGNTMTESRLDHSPMLLEDELAFELQRQRDESLRLQKQSELLLEKSEKLIGVTAQLAERASQMSATISAQETLLNKVHEQMARIENEAKGKAQNAKK